MTACLIVDFINYVYRPESEHFPDSFYNLIYVYDKDILGVVWNYTECFNKTTALGFSQWLNKQNIDFLNQKPEREIVANIVDTIPRHHAYIQQLKDDGVVNIPYQRSLAQKVFVSPSSSVKQALSKRDLVEQDMLSSLDQIHGNTQDFLNYMKKDTKICVVAIDYAGFTTNVSDLVKFLKEHNNIQKMVIDLFFYENDFKIFDRNQLLDGTEDLKLFHCRIAYKQRNK